MEMDGIMPRNAGSVDLKDRPAKFRAGAGLKCFPRKMQHSEIAHINSSTSLELHGESTDARNHFLRKRITRSIGVDPSRARLGNKVAKDCNKPKVLEPV